MGWLGNLFKTQEAQNTEMEIARLEAEEIAGRERYWFDHPFGFECWVTLMEPRERTARVGAYGDHLFGSIPVPFHGQFTDWGQFQVHGDRFVFLGQHCTRVLLFSQILHTHYGEDGSVQFNHQGGVMGFHGPVGPAVIGALVKTGYLRP